MSGNNNNPFFKQNSFGIGGGFNSFAAPSTPMTTIFDGIPTIAYVKCKSCNVTYVRGAIHICLGGLS